MTAGWRPAVLAVLLLSAGAAAPVAQADPVPSPPYIDHVQWAKYGNNQPSLRVYPTKAGRAAAGDLGGSQSEIAEAWAEVLRLAPDANSPGMRAQFACHWKFAEFAEPGKSSWNLEPWRPAVDENTMIQAGCNPGGSEEPS